jgi:hypothetical protein
VDQHHSAETTNKIKVLEVGAELIRNRHANFLPKGSVDTGITVNSHTTVAMQEDLVEDLRTTVRLAGLGGNAPMLKKFRTFGNTLKIINTTNL